MNAPSGTRLEQAFVMSRGQARPAIISFVIPGFPNLEASKAAFEAMVAGGADIIEVEIPFSDPLADGATIQGAVFQALSNGTTPGSCIEFVREMRSLHPETPIVLMTYLNPVLALGIETFAARAAKAGADGVILVDLPPEEAGEARSALRACGLDLILLAAPTTTDERLRLIATQASGFVYCVSVTGTTGVRDRLPEGLNDFLARVRRCIALPLAVGFGMSRREHIDALTGVAEGVIIGSAFVDLLARTESTERARAVREYVEVLSGRRSP
jgi:tryptophan synthase alpha chain